LNTDKVLNIAKLPSLGRTATTTSAVMREPTFSAAKGKPVIKLKRRNSATRRQIAEEGSPSRQQRGKSPSLT